MTFNSRIISLLLWITTFLFTLVIIWGTNKGFDLRDEGYYLLGYSKTQEIGFTDTQFHLIIRNFFHFLDLNIINTRIIRFLANIIAATCLAGTCYLFLKSNKIGQDSKLFNFSNILAIALIGTFTSYGMGIQSFSYNHLNMFFLILTTSLLLIYLSNISKKFQYTSLALIGFLLVFQFFTKFPSAILQLGLVGLVILINQKPNLKSLCFQISYLCFGIVLGSVLYQITVDDVRHAVLGIFLTIKILAENSVGYRNNALWGNIIKSFLQITELFIFSWGIFSTVVSLQKVKQVYRYLILMPLAYILYKIFTEKYLGDYSSHYLLIMLFMILLTTWAHLKNTTWKLKIVLGVFLIEPFVGALGTNTPLLVNSAFYGGFFMVLAWCLVILAKLEITSKTLTVAAGSLMIILTTTLHFYLVHPFKQLPLKNQTHALDFSAQDKKVQVDPGTYQYLKDIHEVVKTNPNRPMIGFYKLPGAIYILGYNSPGSVSHDRTNSMLLCKNLENTKMNLNETIFLERDTVPIRMKDCLKNRGIDYQSYPFVRIESKDPLNLPPLNVFMLPKN